MVAIVAAQLSGFIWTVWGPQWVFFMAALFSLGNLYVAWRVQITRQVPGQVVEQIVETSAGDVDD